MTTYTVIGKPVPRLDGVDKVQGRARYTADVALPGLLWGKVLRSPYPHARILRIDTSRARAIPGVHAVLTAQDLPDTRVGRLMRDLPVLARDKVRFIGERVAAVAADSPDIAEEAALAIEVEYEELPAVFDPEEAMQPGAPMVHEDFLKYPGLLTQPITTGSPTYFFREPGTPVPVDGTTNLYSHVYWAKGNVEEGFRQADHIFEHSFQTQRMHQGYLEPHACVVHADPSDGRVHVWATNKTPFLLRRHLSEGTEVPPERIVVHPAPLGGDFGGKGAPMDAPVAYFLSRATGRPVKMVMTYLEELTAANLRHPARITIRSGVTRDGRLVARQARVVLDSGAYGAFKPLVNINLPLISDVAGSYRIPHVRIDSYMVYTNTVPSGYMRGPGQAQTVFAVEAHTDMIARELGMDPLEFRLRNVVQEGDTSPIGERWEHIRAEETLRAAAQAIGWGSPRPRPYVGRGISLCEHHAIGGPTGVTVRLERDGTVAVLTPVVDTGAGFHLVLRQMVAEVFTVPLEQVQVRQVDTDSVPFDTGVGGSRVTHVAGGATVDTSQQMVAKLRTLAAERLGCQEGETRLEDGAFHGAGRRITLAELAAEAPAEALALTGSAAVPQPEVTCFNAQAAEVEVDPETGQVRVLRYATAHDVGTILNPIGHQGQVDGSIVQGLGYALMEEVQVNEGRVSTPTFGEYKLPSMKDIPPLTTVLLESPTGPGPFRTKAVGELPLSGVAPAIANAIYDAVGVWVTELPITAERVYRALQERGAARPR